MNKMPKDTRFIMPRFYLLIGLYFITKKINKESSKVQGMGYSAAQQQMAMGQFTELIDKVHKLQKGKTERKDFPFGTIKITRL